MDQLVKAYLCLDPASYTFRIASESLFYSIANSLPTHIRQLQPDTISTRHKAVVNIDGQDYIIKAALLEDWELDTDVELSSHTYLAQLLQLYNESMLASRDIKICIQPVDCSVVIPIADAQRLNPRLQDNIRQLGRVRISYAPFIANAMQVDNLSQVQQSIVRNGAKGLMAFLGSHGVRPDNLTLNQMIYTLDLQGVISAWIVDYEDWKVKEG